MNQYHIAPKKASFSFLNFLFYWLIPSIYTISIVFFITDATLIQSNIFQIILLCFFCVGFTYVILWNRWSMIIFIFCLLLFFLFTILLKQLFQYSPLDPLFNTISRIQQDWLKGVFNPQYSFFAIIPLSLIWSLYAVIFFKKIFVFWALLLPQLMIWLIQLSTGTFTPSIFTYVSIGLFLLLKILHIYMDPSTISSEKKHQPNQLGQVAFSSLPLCLIVMLLAVNLSNSFSLMPTGFLSNWAPLHEWFPKEEPFFSFSNTGFQPNPHQIGGNVNINKAPIMNIHFQSMDESYPLHLVGSRKNTYTGSMWSSTLKSFSSLPPDSSYFSKIEQHEKKNFIEKNPLKQHSDTKKNTITATIDMLTSTDRLFLPLHSALSLSSLSSSDSITQNENLDLMISPSLKKSQSYTFSYTDISQPLEEQLRQSFSLPSVLPQYQRYVKWIRQHFLALPDTVSDRVVNKTKELVKNQQDPYEQVRRIEKYLKTIPYTLTPGNVPKNVDVVDYFLFENPQGYCTYYATALSVMARILNIPTRYVEGFAPPAPTQSNTVMVTNEYAHAWVEVFFEDVGWVTFDPTPSITQTLDHSSNPVDSSSSDSLFSSSDDSLNSSDTQDSSEPSTSDVSTMLDAGSMPWNTTSPMHPVFLFFSFIGIFLLFILLLIGIAIYRYQRYFKKLQTQIDMTFSVEYLQKIMVLFKLNHHVKSRHESFSHFFKRMTPHYPTLPLEKIEALFVQQLYGEQKIALTSSQKELIQDFYEQLNTIVKNNLGMIPYVIKYLLPFFRLLPSLNHH